MNQEEVLVQWSLHARGPGREPEDETNSKQMTKGVATVVNLVQIRQGDAMKRAFWGWAVGLSSHGRSLRRDLGGGLDDTSPAMQTSGHSDAGRGASRDKPQEEQASMAGPRRGRRR